MLSKVDANLAKGEVDWTLEKKKMELEVSKAKIELVEAKKEAEEAMKIYKTFEDFAAKKAKSMADFRKLEDIFSIYWAFDQESFKGATIWEILLARSWLQIIIRG